MKKTTQEIEDLKAQWIKDPIWDIEDTEGFEDYRNDLLNFSAEWKEKCDMQFKALVLKTRKETIAPHMSTRLYLAGMILQGIMASSEKISIANGLGANEVGCALMVADELIKQEEESR